MKLPCAPFFAALVFGLLCMLPGMPAAAGQGPITEDLSLGRSFTFAIAPHLPPFTFKLVPLVRPNDTYGNAQSGIREIEVYAADSTKPMQTLTGCDLEDAGPPFTGSDFFRAEDMNFDGYKDIFLVTSQGATGNATGCAWLYNPAAKRFEYNNAVSQLDRFWLDPATRTLFTFANGGAAGMVHTAQRFKVEDNRPVMIWSENQDWDDASSRFHCVVKERRGAKMTVIRDSWSTANSGQGACDPSVLFQGLPKQE